MIKRTDIHQDERAELYEIGYLVVPTVAEEQLPAVVQDIKNVLEKHQAIISKEGMPNMITLAYEIAKATVGKKHMFNRAYFGWITFTASTEQVLEVKKALDGMEKILRFILIKTDEDVVIATPDVPVVLTTEAKVSDEEIDKKIDNLVVA